MSRLINKTSIVPTPPLGGIREELQRDSAYNQLRRLLIFQQIQPGSRLAELEWASRLGVNRTALREAFARLEAEGLVRRGEKTGYVTPVLSTKDERDILLVRLALEGAAIEIICSTGLNTPEAMEKLEGACSLLERLVDEQFHLSIVEADWRFHESLVEAAGNEVLTMAYRHAPVRILHAAIVGGPDWQKREERSSNEHREILAAIMAGRPEEAKRVLRDHLVGSWAADRGVNAASA